jgi:uncharacterized membrane protein
MEKGRLEAFSDGVIAIIITIMVLEMKVPRGGSFDALKPLLPIFLSYVFSFINVGIYWNNHHHMIHATKHVNGSVLWANIHLLFWLSLFPFVTAFMGENQYATIPVALYGFVSLMSGVAYYMLAQCLIAVNGKKSTLAIALGKDKKGITSVVVYALGIGLAFINPWLGVLCYVFVAGMWFIPDKRIEDKISKDEANN